MENVSTKCPNHPFAQVTFTCARCGTFGCEACRSSTQRTLCTTCGSRLATEGLPVVETFQESLRFLQQRPNLLLTYAGAYAVYGLVVYQLRQSLDRTLHAGGLGTVLASIPLLLALVGVGLFFQTVAELILIRYVGDQLEGQEQPPGDTVRAAMGRFVPSIGSNCVAGLGIALGSLLCIVPGFIVAVAWCLAMPAVVLGNAGPIESLTWSWERTEGHRLNLFLLLLLCVAVLIGLGLVSGLVSLILGTLGSVGALLAALLQQAVSAVGLCLMVTALVFSYLKLSGQWIPSIER